MNIVLLSGGQDSTTILFDALSRSSDRANVRALSIVYGQRHAREIDSAEIVAHMAGVELEIVALPESVLRGTSPLVSSAPVGHYDAPSSMPTGIEPTFVPLRNLLFLTIAANRAANFNEPSCVWIGVGQEDHDGYPDCRPDFLTRAQDTIREALRYEVEIVAPLLFKSKRATVDIARSLPGCWEALAYSHTCYDGAYPPNPKNHASILRAKGFHEAGFADPLIERAIREGLLPSDYPSDGYVFGTKYAEAR